MINWLVAHKTYIMNSFLSQMILSSNNIDISFDCFLNVTVWNGLDFYAILSVVTDIVTDVNIILT